ncbi:SIMPL domain-containing protein [Streptomyces roseirectus]|uniref:SIMPL domain-containing protein n=1 Tax=Streptomyces roseirectus TaxID=2768066 RepID=A0A7H0IKH1_9ACTN|nr:SIMPL domain-containing protein [Streptomyces roseirectus]QNP73287.1 SIMPL domain-containing protein [Streptomyces roseirectus]
MTHGTPDAPLLTVRGEAATDAEPETARLGVTVTAEGRDRHQVLDDLTRAHTTALGLLTAHPVERVTTPALTVAPAYVLDEHGGQHQGHQGRAHLTVHVTDLTTLGALLTRLADLDLITVEGPHWELRPDSPVPADVRRAAVREAVRRAHEYADALGTTLAALIELTDEGGRVPRPRAAFAQTARRVSAAPPPPLDLEPPHLTVEAAVTARFTLHPPALDR